jgi:DNA mismatch endonuclease (patch repair protein)
MADNDRNAPPNAATSARMRAVRQRDTEPEIAVRRILHGLGIRYRACPQSLPGRPDIANRKRRWAIFVHGCFWHGHDCRLGTKPKSNAEWWLQKIAANRERDARKTKALESLGFQVLTVWQCDLDAPSTLAARLTSALLRERERL